MLVFRALSSNCHEAGGREVALAGPNCYCGTPVLQLMSFTLVTPREQTLTRFEIISAENHLQIMADIRSKKEEIFMDVVYVVLDGMLSCSNFVLICSWPSTSPSDRVTTLKT